MRVKRKGKKPRLKRREKIGKPPGTLIHLGEKKTDNILITIYDFGPDGISLIHSASLDDCFRPIPDRQKRWINIDGLHDTAAIAAIGREFSIHSLILEDILNTTHRPKFEEHESYAFIVCKMLHLDPSAELETEHLSILVKENLVISFQERPGDVFNSVRERINNRSKRLNEGGAGYLAYSLLDTIVDSYYGVLEELGEQVESLQYEAIDSPDPYTAQKITALKRSLLTIRRTIWPIRELILAMQRSDRGLFPDSLNLYLRDIYDHVVSIIDMIETDREMLSATLELYLSGINIKMNKVLNTLTIFATIFLPLTFIAGVYGMNFENMPELSWEWGYYLVLLFMGSVAAGMLIYFKKRNWL